MAATGPPLVGVVMGSDSDLQVVGGAGDVLRELGVPHEVRVVSAHRTPHDMISYGAQAADRGLRVIVAGAGGAAHLPGMLAAVTTLPVIGVPVRSSALDGLDSLLSIVQMPRGVPVATVAIDGGRNAGLLAAQILAISDPELARRVAAVRAAMAEAVATADEKVPLLRAYLKRWRMEVGVFFSGVGPDSPDEELRRIAPDHPVFRLGPT